MDKSTRRVDWRSLNDDLYDLGYDLKNVGDRFELLAKKMSWGVDTEEWDQIAKMLITYSKRIKQFQQDEDKGEG